MNVIQLTRMATPEAKAKLLQELEVAYADKKNVSLLKVAIEEEEIEAVLIPNHPTFSRIFKKIVDSKDTMRSEFQWNDHELEAVLGLGIMQANFSKVSKLVFFDPKKKGELIFALVNKEFYEANQKF